MLRFTGLALALTLAVTPPAGARPTIAVTPPDVVEGQPVHVVVTGLRPGETVELHAARTWSAYPTGDEEYRGRASFTADARGTVDLATAVPLAGSSYERADPAGLFWSMAAEKRSRLPAANRPAAVATDRLEPGVVRIDVESAGRIVASTEARLRAGAADVVVRDVREPDLVGVYARGSAPGRQPAVIVLGGSEGGLFTARWAAPLLASNGHAVLGVAYFRDELGPSHLPPNLENIPLETIERARDWLARQPGVDASRVAVVGVSKGAELALVAAATFPWVTAVGAFAPSHVVWEGVPPRDQPDRAAGSSWTYRGKPLPFVRWSRAAERRSDLTRRATGSSRLTEVHLESLAEFAADVPAATIEIERSRAAIFVAAGTDDGLWPAAYSAERLRERLARRDPRLVAVFEIHPTGHLIMGSGWGPTTQFQGTTGRLQGGNARLDAEAQKVIWPAFLKFLREQLPAVEHPAMSHGVGANASL